MSRENFSDHMPRRNMHPILRGLNIAFATLVSLAFVVTAGDYALRGIDGYLPEKISSFLTVITGVSGAWLIFTHALKNASPLTLLMIFPVAAAVSFGLDYLVFNFIPGAGSVDRIHDLRIIDAALFYCAFYLMLWDRGARIEAGDDTLTTSIHSIPTVWPVIFLLAGLIGVEFLIWY